jgi:hypothetical protein
MSHTVRIETKFNQFDSLKAAFAKLGWTIKENSTARTYASDPARSTKYQYVAVNPKNGYDLGLKVKQDGEVEVYGDFFDGSIQQQLGQQLCELKKQYGIQVIEDKYLYEGYTVNYENLKNGCLEVVVEM